MTGDPIDIVNWRRIDAQLTTSGQPDEAQLATIRALGVRHVVNLALHSHPQALPDEGAMVAALGMAYHHIPVDFEAPTEEDFTRFCTTMMKIGEQPVHVHCILNLRVTAFLYRYHRDVIGMDEARAQTPMDTVWQPGGVWATFVGKDEDTALPHRGPKAG